MSFPGQLAAGTCEIVTLDRDSSQPRRTIARQTARCACKKGQIAGTTRARPACVDGKRRRDGGDPGLTCFLLKRDTSVKTTQTWALFFLRLIRFLHWTVLVLKHMKEMSVKFSHIKRLNHVISHRAARVFRFLSRSLRWINLQCGAKWITGPSLWG